MVFGRYDNWRRHAAIYPRLGLSTLKYYLPGLGTGSVLFGLYVAGGEDVLSSSPTNLKIHRRLCIPHLEFAYGLMYPPHHGHAHGHGHGDEHSHSKIEQGHKAASHH